MSWPTPAGSLVLPAVLVQYQLNLPSEHNTNFLVITHWIEAPQSMCRSCHSLNKLSPSQPNRKTSQSTNKSKNKQELRMRDS